MNEVGVAPADQQALAAILLPRRGDVVGKEVQEVRGACASPNFFGSSLLLIR